MFSFFNISIYFRYSKDDVFTIQYATTYISQNLDNVIPSIERICHPNFYSNTAAYDAAILRVCNSNKTISLFTSEM